jgi:hypothetical protein
VRRDRRGLPQRLADPHFHIEPGLLEVFGPRALRAAAGHSSGVRRRPGFLSCLDRADAGVLGNLHDHVSQKRGREDPLAALVYQVLSRRRSGQPAKR